MRLPSGISGMENVTPEPWCDELAHADRIAFDVIDVLPVGDIRAQDHAIDAKRRAGRDLDFVTQCEAGLQVLNRQIERAAGVVDAR